MIQTILQKALNNLNAEKPDLSYVRGMLEVLLAIQEKEVQPVIITKQDGTYKSFTPPVKEQPKDEGQILDSMAKASMETVKKMATLE